MKHSIKHTQHDTNRSANSLYRLALLGGALLGLSALNAQGQTVIRRNVTSRQVTFANGQTATVYASYAALPAYAYLNYINPNYVVPNYVNPGYINPNYALNRSVSAVGNYNLANSLANRAIGAVGAVALQTASSPPSPTQASDAITAQYAGSSQLLVQWSGNSNGVLQVKLAVFDANYNLLDAQTVTQLPVAARFAMTADIAYYGAQVVYSSGKITTTYQPIQ